VCIGDGGVQKAVAKYYSSDIPVIVDPNIGGNVWCVASIVVSVAGLCGNQPERGITMVCGMSYWAVSSGLVMSVTRRDIVDCVWGLMCVCIVVLNDVVCVMWLLLFSNVDC